jgi:hypothetical protein
MMNGGARVMLLFVLFAGCRGRPAQPPAVEDLRFPVVVIYGKSSAMLFPDAAALGTARIGDLNAVVGPPPLIDSNFGIYTLQEFGSTHGGLWLMTHPTGSTPVKFKLERAPKSGLEIARGLMRARLDEQTWRGDLPERREALAREQTLAGMAAVVEGKND